MSNEAYPKTIEAALGAVCPNTVKIRALKSSYVYSTAHDFFNDVPSGDRLGSSVALTTVAFTNGILTADDPTITGLSNGDAIAAFVLYNDTGTESTSRLLAFIDTDASGAPISVTSDGSDLPLAFPGVTILSY